MTYDDATRRLARLLQSRASEAMTSTAASVRQEAQRAAEAVTTGGISATVALAAITPGGSAGSLTVTNGIITAYVPPT